MSLILISGKISKVYFNNVFLKDLKEITTKDGTITLKSMQYDENFHSLSGALKETQIKFINPSLLDRFKDKRLRVLDVCFGLGYNSALLFNNLLSQSSTLDWFALEIDKEPLQYSIKNNLFRKLWNPKVLTIFESLLLKNIYIDDYFDCKLIWGDARKGISSIPQSSYFDLIFLDGFSPQKCPQIWSLEFLSKLTEKLKSDGYLVTYSSAAAIRKSLIKQGLNIFNIKPSYGTKNRWSNGTVAMKKVTEENPFIEKLSIMEKEHLKTKASVPYRDREDNSLPKEILRARIEEQHKSKLISTSNWRKKWGLTKSTLNS